MSTYGDLRARYFARRQADRDPALGPSDVGACRRALAYRLHRVPATDHDDTRAADVGSLIHLGYSQMVEEVGGPNRFANVKVHVPGLSRFGEADDVDFDARIVTDLKTVGARRWQAWVDADGPEASVWGQVSLYGLGLYAEWGGSWMLRIVAVNRDNGHEAEWMRPLSVVDAQETAQAMADLEAALLTRTPEEAPRDGYDRGRFPCSFCSWASACWPEQPAVPEPADNLTLPERTAAHAAALAYLEASREEREAAERKARARADLATVTGTINDVRVTWSKPSERVEVDPAAAADMLSTLGEEVPTRVVRRAPTIRVSRVAP